MTVGGLVPRVEHRRFRPLCVLRGRVLPSVAMLQLEVRVAAPFPDAEADAVVLTQIAIAAHP